MKRLFKLLSWILAKPWSQQSAHECKLGIYVTWIFSTIHSIWKDIKDFEPRLYWTGHITATDWSAKVGWEFHIAGKNPLRETMNSNPLYNQCSVACSDPPNKLVTHYWFRVAVRPRLPGHVLFFGASSLVSVWCAYGLIMCAHHVLTFSVIPAFSTALSYK